MSASQSQSAAPTTGPKLRDSCHGCAASKLKCNKEKPTCARCAKRGIPCEYFASRRVGRKQGARPVHATVVTQTLPPTPTVTSWPASMSVSETLTTSPRLTRLSPNPSLPGYSDSLPGFLTSGDPISASGASLSGFQFDDFLASPISFPILNTPVADCLTDPGPINVRNDTSASLDQVGPGSAFDQAALKPPLFSKPVSPRDSRPSTAASFRPEPSSCCCLARALSLLKEVSPAASVSCQTSTRDNCEPGLAKQPTLQAVIANNQQTIKTVSSMLNCQCSDDGYLLTIMALIVFKIFGLYAIAGRQTSGLDPIHGPESGEMSQLNPQRLPDCYSADGESNGRMAAQMVLGELHRAQKLVNSLSPKLKSHGMHSRARSDPMDRATSMHGSGTPLASSDGGTASPLPVTMLHQLEIDLRARLRALSAEIVETLRGS